MGVVEPNNRDDGRVPTRAYHRLMGMVLAHQGGWDEILFVALPLGLFAFLLFVANRKAQSQLDAEEQNPETESESEDS
ncbi:MAG: hypothetical protein QOI95_1580 [Acidimicrobiaceae bacterium]|jgi:hypothetical protein